MKRLVIGILAHVDSGKTTLSEAMLYHAGALRKLGRVDHRDAFLDTDALERARGITIFAKQAVLRLPDTEITLLDTPGHVDFSAEAERASRLLHLPVYGGDCIVEPDGSFYFIDFNDWPSFSCCREAASAAIAARVLRAIEHNESFRNYEQQPGSDIQVAGYGRMA